MKACRASTNAKCSARGNSQSNTNNIKQWKERGVLRKKIKIYTFQINCFSLK